MCHQLCRVIKEVKKIDQKIKVHIDYFSFIVNLEIKKTMPLKLKPNFAKITVKLKWNLISEINLAMYVK